MTFNEKIEDYLLLLSIPVLLISFLFGMVALSVIEKAIEQPTQQEAVSRGYAKYKHGKFIWNEQEK